MHNFQDNRPTNRLGCSRAFHQTKENWKDDKGAHSLPRQTTNLQQEDSGQYSCKATSSSTSLTINK